MKLCCVYPENPYLSDFVSKPAMVLRLREILIHALPHDCLFPLKPLVTGELFRALKA